MSAATITPIDRRPFGLSRPTYSVRCADCKTRTEVRTPQLAESIRQRHVCKEEKP